MAWTIEFSKTAEKEIEGLDRSVQLRIRSYLKERVATLPNPRQLGEALSGDRGGLWRYRIGDYRVICSIQDKNVVVLVLSVGHRREIYR